MHIKSIKRILWVLNAVLVAAIVLVALKFFILDGKTNRQPRDAENILGQVNLPSARPDKDRKRREILPAESFRVTYELVIDGDLPVEIEVDNTVNPTMHLAPLARDYELRWTKVDPNLMESYAHLVKTAEPDPKKVIYIRPGDKIGGGWKLVMVRPGRADFVEETSGEEVTLEQVEEPIRTLDGPGADPTGSEPLPIAGGNDVPEQPRDAPTREAVQVRDNEWQVTREERRWWSDHGESELEAVAVTPVKDPVTGKPAGVELKTVRKGSMIQKRGLLPGDVLVSINDHPVTTRADAVSWVKGPGKGLPSYRVVIQRKGRLITMTYKVRGAESETPYHL